MSSPARPRVFVSAPLLGDGVARLTAVADVVVGETGVGVAKMPDREFDAIVALLTDRIDRAFLAETPRVRLVANVAVGVDHVDLDACRERGVRVTHTPDVLTDATADLTFALILAAARRVAEGDRMVRRGEFPAWTLGTMLGSAVHHRTLGLVGLGRIGRAVARRARGFSMPILYHQRHRADAALEQELGATWAPLDELCARADVVSLHCPLTPETRGLFDGARFARMKPGSIFVNTARGGCVDEAALARALRDGPLGAAGLDVFRDEPHVEPSLRDAPNAVLTPHVGSAERATRTAMADVAVANVLAWIAGQPLPTPFPGH
jgi:glyoxylate reductase